MRQFIQGVDPGEITGLFFLDLGTGVFASQELGFREAGRTLRQTMSIYGYDLDVVCERFVITPETHKKTQEGHWSMEVTGLARFFSWEFCGQDLFGYMPQKERKTPHGYKTFATMARLKALGWWVPTKDGHGNDAARQVLVYLVEHGWWDDRIGTKVTAETR